MRCRTYFTCLALASGTLIAPVAHAQEQGQRDRDAFFAAGGEDPLSFGDDDNYVDFAPFVEGDAGWTSASPSSLLAPGDSEETRIRQGRLFIDYGFAGRFGGLAVVDFANLEDNAVPYLWLDYEATDRLTFRVGQQDANFSFQQRLGARPALFAITGANGVLQAPAAVGVSLLYAGDDRGLQIGVEGNDINDRPFDDGIAVSARGTIAPYLAGENAVHLGLGLAASFDRQHPFSFAGGAGTGIVDASLISTRDFGPTGETRSANLELAATIDRFTLQSEYTVLHADGFQRAGATLHGGYLGALFFLTPDQRTYDAGTGLFERVDPASPVTEGGWGAFEIGARLDYLDLTDDGPQAGAQISGTAIASWYPTMRFRLTATHVYTHLTDGPDSGGDINSTLLRASFVY